MEKKKKKNALGWWQKLNAGDPEKNIEIFNHMMTDHPNISSESSGTSSEAAMAEAIESIIKNPQTNLEAIKALDLMDEKFNSEKDLEDHFQKHCRAKLKDEKTGKYTKERQYDEKRHVIWFDKSKDQYEKDAENLQNSKVSKQIKWYELKIGDDIYKTKYDTRKNDFVIYATNEPNGDSNGNITVSYYGLNPTYGLLEYMNKKNKDSQKGDVRELSIGEALKELDS